MKFLMIAVFLITANAGVAFGEGRYTAIAGAHDDIGLEGVYVIDTKTGQVKFCYGISYKVVCTDYTEQ